MPRRACIQNIKSHRTYEVWEAAIAVGVTPQTVRAWIRNGLRAMTGSRPFLILGADLKDFIKSASTAKKRPLRIGEFYCLRCKAPHTPAFDMADYLPLSASHGRLAGYCGACDGPFSRIVSRSDLPRWQQVLRIGGSAIAHAYENPFDVA